MLKGVERRFATAALAAMTPDIEPTITFLISAHETQIVGILLAQSTPISGYPTRPDIIIVPVTATPNPDEVVLRRRDINAVIDKRLKKELKKE